MLYCGHKTELFLDNLCDQESDNLRDHKQQKGEKSIDEMFRMSDVANDKDRKAKNWTTQLKEYDADSFAVTIQAVLFL